MESDNKLIQVIRFCPVCIIGLLFQECVNECAVFVRVGEMKDSTHLSCYFQTRDESVVVSLVHLFCFVQSNRVCTFFHYKMYQNNSK